MPAGGSWLDDSPKRFTVGTDRARRPDETLEAVTPRFRSLGITRVADVTGLDRIGIPVHLAVRPNSRSLAVSQGKGVDPLASQVSAVMESIELAHAERYRPPTRVARFVDLLDDAAVAPPLDPGTLHVSRDSRYTPFAPVVWTEAHELLRDRRVSVPLELVYADMTLPELPGCGAFVRSTNGLASGNTPAEALLAALCELIERDAESVWLHRPEELRSATRLDLATVDDPVCLDLLNRFEAADVAVVAWDVTSDVGVSAFRVLIVDRDNDELLRPMSGAHGAGCHPRREVALARALTEAAQSRLTAISGTRDDLTRARYRATQQAEVLARHRALVAESGSAVFASAPTTDHTTIGADVAHVLHRLAAAGVSAVAACSLADDDLPYTVARVVVADLEGPVEAPRYRPGRRAAAAMAGGPP